MRCLWTQTFGFRALADVRLDWHPRLNVIVGDNGAGKSSLLETLQIAGRGRSARGPASSIVRHAQPAWRVEAGVTSDSEVAQQVRVDWQNRQTAITWNGKPASVLELAVQMPVLRIEPDSHRLLDDGPAMRRQLIDWGVFHMEHRFVDDWRQARYCLQQRNAALRSGLPKAEVSMWNHELEIAAVRIDEARVRYVEALKAVSAEYAGISDGQNVDLAWHAGWNREEGLAASLDRSYERDRAQGHTSVGPHRAELRILKGGRLAKGRVSRGQQKALIAQIVLAQIEVFHQRMGSHPILLIDDFASELSRDAQIRLLHYVDRSGSQTFMTSLDPPQRDYLSSAHMMFHVEHGHVVQQSLQ